MNFYATIVTQRHDARSEKCDPPQDAPTDFWLDVLYYQKMFNTEWKTGMKGFGPQNFSHLSIHAEMQLEEMVLKWDEEAIFWMFDEIGSFIIDESELKPQPEHEYVVQKATHPQFSTYEVYDATEDEVAWGADSTDECYDWITMEKCAECGKWTNDFFMTEDGAICAEHHEDV